MMRKFRRTGNLGDQESRNSAATSRRTPLTAGVTALAGLVACRCNPHHRTFSSIAAAARAPADPRSQSRGTIRLNWSIIQAPMRLVDYVVVHEVVHLRHRGHGRDYWQALGRVMPDYEGRREDLRQLGSRLTW